MRGGEAREGRDMAGTVPLISLLEVATVAHAYQHRTMAACRIQDSCMRVFMPPRTVGENLPDLYKQDLL